MRKDVQRHLESAAVFLQESEHLLSGGFFRGTIGRAYYAMFHAATAALLAKGIERSSHHAVIAAFGEFLVKPGSIAPQFHKHLIETFTLRNDCDYLAPCSPEEGQAKTALQRARRFVEACTIISTTG